MDVASESIGGVIDLVTEHPCSFISSSTLVTHWVDRGEGRLRDFFEHVGCAWSHRMINILW